MKVRNTVIVIALTLLFFSCEAIVGPAGPAGEAGPAGPAGTIFLKSYTGTMTGETQQLISIPEIKNKIGITFVMAYYASPSSSTVWTPITDGMDYVDADPCVVAISWYSGSIWITYGNAGDLYMINVYQTN